MTNSKRNYGIDLLRITAMFFIVVLHMLRKGGLTEAAESENQIFAVWILQAIVTCAVNCYGLISGYVNVDSKKARYYKLGELWCKVAFYNLILTIIFYFILTPNGDDSFKPVYWNCCIFPVYTTRYWYFTAYFPLFFFMPYLNKMINAMTKTERNVLGIIIIVIFTVMPVLMPVLNYDTVELPNVFRLQSGYSFAWLMLLYILGGIMKKNDWPGKLSKLKWSIVFAVGVTLTWGLKFIFEATGFNIKSDTFYNYTSITIIACGISLLCVFLKTDIKNNFAIKAIKIASPVSFGVYLIHTNQFIFNHVLDGATVKFAENKTIVMMLQIIGLSVGVYLACSVIDFLVSKLFKLLHIAPALKKLEDKIYAKIHKHDSKELAATV